MRPGQSRLKSIVAPTPSELAVLLAHLLSGAAGGTQEEWCEIIGPVHKLSIVDHVHSNWEVIPGGTGKQRAAIAKAVLVVRAEHPYAA